MNTATNTELAKIAETSQVGALALISLSPEKYTAEVYKPFNDQLATAIDSVRAIDYDIKTTAGMAVAIKCRALFRDMRVAADKERQSRKAPIIKIGKLLESGYDQVEERITPLEALFDSDIANEVQRKEDEKQAKIAAERVRTERIQGVIQAIRDLPLLAVGKTSSAIRVIIDSQLNTESDASFEEFIEQAKAARLESLDKLAAMETTQRGIEVQAESDRQEAARQAAIAEEARKAESARVEAERVELARLRAETERMAAELKAQADAQAEAARKEQAERDRVAADVKRQLDEQQAAIAAQAKALAEQQAAADARDAAAKAAAQDAVRRGDDHGPALAMNAQFDADRAAELARCTDEAKAMLTAGRSLVGQIADEDAGDDPSDMEIVGLFVVEFGGTHKAAIERLARFDAVAARAELVEMAA